MRARSLVHLLGGGAVQAHVHGVEEVLRDHLVAQRLHAGGQRGRGGVHAGGDAAQSIRTVIDAVEGGDVGKQRLCGADVAGGLVAADVLFARLDGKAQRGTTVRVAADTDQATRHAAHEGVLGGEVRGVWAAKAHRHTEALHGSERHIRAQFARRREQRQGQRIGHHRHQRAGGLHLGDHAAPIGHATIGGRIGEQCTAVVLGREVGGVRVTHHQRHAQSLRAGLDHRDGLRMAVGGHEEGLALAITGTQAQAHGLGRRGAFIEQACTGHFHAGELGAHGLEVQQALQSTLRHFGLIGRVLRVPTRILEHVSQDHRGRDAVVVAHADVAAEHLILLRQRVDGRKALRLAARLEATVVGGIVDRETLGAQDRARHRGLGERVQAVVSQERQHLGDVGIAGPDVPLREGVERLERGGGGVQVGGRLLKHGHGERV